MFPMSEEHQHKTSLREQTMQPADLEQHYREIFEWTKDLIFACDLDGRIIFTHPRQRVL